MIYCKHNFITFSQGMTNHVLLFTPAIKYYFQKGKKDALDDRMNKPLSPRRKSPDKKNVASLQVKIKLRCYKVINRARFHRRGKTY